MAIELNIETTKYLERLLKRGGHEGEQARNVLKAAGLYKGGDDQPRDSNGQFASGGGGGGGDKEPSTHGRFKGNLDVTATPEHSAKLERMAAKQDKEVQEWREGEKRYEAFHGVKNAFSGDIAVAQGRAVGIRAAAEMYRNGATHKEVLDKADSLKAQTGTKADPTPYYTAEGMYLAVKGGSIGENILGLAHTAPGIYPHGQSSRK